MGGLAAGALVLVLSSEYSVAGGYGVLGPYSGIGSVLGLSGSTAIAVGVLVDLVIPIVVGLVMVGTLALLSRTRLRFLELRSYLRAVVEGGLLGLVVWGVFYVPVIDHLSGGAPLSSLASSLEFGLAEHVLFGAVLGVVIFAVGGPIAFRPGAPSEAPEVMADPGV